MAKKTITRKQENMVKAACEFFAENYTKGFYKEVGDLVSRDMAELSCCVLWKRDEKFEKICQNHGIEPGKKEVVITRGAVRGTHSWSKEPTEYLYY